MIKLNQDTFRRALEKAARVRPACNLVDENGAYYTFTVARSDGGAAIVDIWMTGGCWWSSCDCPAGVGEGRRGVPQPCYHVAAAALSLGFLPAALPMGAAFDPAPECAATPQVPAPLIDVRELAPLEPSTDSAESGRSQNGSLWSVVRAIAARFCWLSPRSARA